MLTNIRYIFITALRDWLFLGLMVAVLCATGIAAILGGTAFLEAREMTITYAAGSSRIILMLGLIVFVCFHIRNAFDTKEIDVILSRPISRSNLVIAYWLGFMLVALILAVPIVSLVGIIGIMNVKGYLFWGISLLLESGIVVALALFSAFAMRSAVTSVLGCMGLYVVSRMMIFFVMTAENPMFSDLKFIVFRYMLKGISMLMPRLDFFAKTEWLVYGLPKALDWQLFFLQAGVFIPFLILASIADFRRKQF